VFVDAVEISQAFDLDRLAAWVAKEHRPVVAADRWCTQQARRMWARIVRVPGFMAS
jgi:hypothetical protein